MKIEAKEIFAEARRAHEAIYVKLISLRASHLREMSLEEMTDSVYALKEADKAIEDVGREVRKLHGLLEKLICVGWVQKATGEPIRTKHCTGSPDVKTTVKVPKSGTPEYEEFCKHFGVDPALPFRPHWPSMLERVSADLAAGKSIPPGCDPNELVPQYVVTIRNKKGVGVSGEPEPTEGSTPEEEEVPF